MRSTAGTRSVGSRLSRDGSAPGPGLRRSGSRVRVRDVAACCCSARRRSESFDRGVFDRGRGSSRDTRPGWSRSPVPRGRSHSGPGSGSGSPAAPSERMTSSKVLVNLVSRSRMRLADGAGVPGVATGRGAREPVWIRPARRHTRSVGLRGDWVYSPPVLRPPGHRWSARATGSRWPLQLLEWGGPRHA